jgi:hypothetical protein
MIDRAAGGSGVVKVHAFRRDELMTFDVAIAEAPLDTCWLTVRESAPADAAALREAWLAHPARRRPATA